MDKEIKKILRDYSLKVTKIRLDVLRLLLDSGIAMSHAEISKRLGNDIDKVTLYRTLNKFNEIGLAHKVATEDRNWLYAVYEREAHEPEDHKHDHAHFICDECDKIYCFPVDQHSLEIENQHKMGFNIRTREIRLHGTCPVCQ